MEHVKEAVRMLRNNPEAYRPLITHKLSMSGFHKAMDYNQGREALSRLCFYYKGGEEMKLVGIEDLFIPKEYIENGFKPLESLGLDVNVLDWGIKGF